MQHPLPAQRAPAQQGCPGPPHWRQKSTLHTVPAPQVGVDDEFRQQGCPAPPHAAQLPTTQREPSSSQLAAAGVVEYAQQRWPIFPHAEHRCPVQVPSFAPQAAPEAKQAPA
jgi:hypothetical protein